VTRLKVKKSLKIPKG